MTAPPSPVVTSGWRRWRPLVIAFALALLIVGVVAWWFLRGVADFGDETRRVVSPTGEFEVVQYEFSAMIDPGWNLAIERAEGGGREWFWRSVEGPAPETIRFLGNTSVEVVDGYGGIYRMTFDPASIEPDKRYCLRPEYCHSSPWYDYTHTE